MFRCAPSVFRILRVPSQTLIINRGLKAEKKLFRTKLPRYKLDLGSLPPLTELLTQTELCDNVTTLEQLFSEKLTVYKQYLPSDTKHVLLEALFNPSNDIDQLLRIIDENLPTMTSFYIATSFEVLDDMMRYHPDIVETVAVSPELRRLATRALYKVRYFDSDELLKLIKCATTLGMPEDTLLVQSGLQMIRHLINDFEPDELKSLEEHLEKFKVIDSSDRSLLVAIKKAVPKALSLKSRPHRTQIPSK